MSQKELAEKADITPSFLSQVEREHRAASLTVLGRIAGALRVPVELIVWEAIQLPPKLSRRDQRIIRIAKQIISGTLRGETRAGHC